MKGFAMKWFKSLFIFFVMFLTCNCFGATIKWERGKNIDVCIITFTAAETASSPTTASFGVDGTALRIVIDAAATDAANTVAATDISGQSYISITNACAAASEVSYVLTAQDASSNVYGGVPVAGVTTLTLTNCSDMGATIVYIYYQH